MNTERKLYQWDTGQKLVGCTGLYVDFPIDNEVYRVETADGMCIIPDELLQTSGGHKVYECMTNNTIRSFAFSVTPRPQPPDYVFTPTERLTFEGLVQKVDDAVADMIRRADSGEFDGHTPIKGTDYFTASEIQQIQNEVSSGAIGEFKSVVDTETKTFNNNAETKFNAYNQNDSQKTTAYNTNATEKLNAYNTNANNRLAEFDAHTEQIQNEVSSGAIGEFKSVVDTETKTFNANATEKVNAYNQNDSEKTASYNANATKKLNAYNSNANNKVAEFDSHTEQIQTDISELKSDLNNTRYYIGMPSTEGELKTVDSVDKMTDTTKKYILESTGTIWEYSSTKVPAFTNLANVIDEGFRLNSSVGLTAEAGSTTVEDYIDFVTGDVVRVKGLTLGTKNCSLYNSSKAIMTNFKPVVDGVVQGVTTALNDGVYTLTSGTSAKVKYLRVAGVLSGPADDVIITRNEEITYTDVHEWVDTGVTPVSKGSLYDAIEQNSNNISELSERVTSLETGSGTLTIPSFWQNAVDECIAKIKALQVGKNCITFPFFSDNHQRNGYSGVLIAHIMKECNIPYCFYGGDSISSGTIADEATMIEQDRLFDNIMSYVPNEKMCRAVGNHDGYWYDGTSKYYYGREQIYELFLREESVSQSKHFGGDGTYYYVDDIASKTRFVIMNTNKQRVDNVATGESIDAAQIDWLENKALAFNESGWAVVFIGHAPITNNFHALISNAQAVQTFLTNYINGSSVNKADVVGWFSGHIHRDRFYKCDATGNNQTDAGNPVYDESNPSTNTLPFMTVTITSDNTSISYDASTKHSIANDDQSHAIDFVTINKTTRTVNLTRLGIGEDRSYTY